MPLSYLTGLDVNSDFEFIKKRLNLDNLLYIGIRDIDKYEKDIIEKYKIKYLTCDEINTNLEESLEFIINFISDSPVHVSFDVDCMDPGIICCTGTKSNNGLNLNVKKILDSLINLNIVNMDITEINLELGDDMDKKRSISNILYIFNRYLRL